MSMHKMKTITTTVLNQKEPHPKAMILQILKPTFIAWPDQFLFVKFQSLSK